ncbi:MAG: hypothetical protein WBN55_12975 [Eudoraea sp.]|uniref:hypothetical protein n=1 Tax=Eudoraea sp. TaxID=1979955 RepID=UPI003C776053
MGETQNDKSILKRFLKLVLAFGPGIMRLINSRHLKKSHKTNIWINLGLGASLLFTCIISYNGVLALLTYF